jgi:hypothetical protein
MEDLWWVFNQNLHYVLHYISTEILPLTTKVKVQTKTLGISQYFYYFYGRIYSYKVD